MTHDLLLSVWPWICKQVQYSSEKTLEELNGLMQAIYIAQDSWVQKSSLQHTNRCICNSRKSRTWQYRFVSCKRQALWALFALKLVSKSLCFNQNYLFLNPFNDSHSVRNPIEGTIINVTYRLQKQEVAIILTSDVGNDSPESFSSRSTSLKFPCLYETLRYIFVLTRAHYPSGIPTKIM